MTSLDGKLVEFVDCEPKNNERYADQSPKYDNLEFTGKEPNDFDAKIEVKSVKQSLGSVEPVLNESKIVAR